MKKTTAKQFRTLKRGFKYMLRGVRRGGIYKGHYIDWVQGERE